MEHEQNHEGAAEASATEGTTEPEAAASDAADESNTAAPAE